MDIPNAIVGLNGPSQRLGGKIALVTGGGSGIGRATCLCFGSEGAAVIVVDRDRASAIDTVALIEAGGGRAFALGADVVSDATTIVDTALEQFGGLHICMNNAGIDLPSAKGVVETTDADLDRILAVNVVGLFRVSRAAIPAIRASGGGTIINVGSTAAEVGVRDEAAYAASKGAVVSLTRQMATDYAPEIHVDALSPGMVEKPTIDRANAFGPEELAERERRGQIAPLGRATRHVEVAAAALFLASDESSAITGTTLFVDGGSTRCRR